MAANNEAITPQIVDDISPEVLERVGEVISKIEESKQQTALAQIKATSEDNERQFEFAKLQSEISKDKWNKSFLVGVSAAIALGGTGLYLLINGDTTLGIGLLAILLQAFLPILQALVLTNSHQPFLLYTSIIKDKL